MPTRAFAIGLAMLSALAAAPAAASHCVGHSTSAPELDVALPTGDRVYADHDDCGTCLVPVWIYQESNGLDGLQRLDGNVDDTCHGRVPSDTLIF